MQAILPDVYRTVATIAAAAAPTSLLMEHGLPAVEKWGIVGLLFVISGFFVKLWRDSDNAKQLMMNERIKKLEERNGKLEAELQKERAIIDSIRDRKD